jgi:hypothetical protein
MPNIDNRTELLAAARDLTTTIGHLTLLVDDIAHELDRRRDRGQPTAHLERRLCDVEAVLAMAVAAVPMNRLEHVAWVDTCYPPADDDRGAQP